MFLRQEMFISTLTNSKWREALFEGNYSFHGKSATSRESHRIWNWRYATLQNGVTRTFPFPRKVSVRVTGVLWLKCQGIRNNLHFGSRMSLLFNLSSMVDLHLSSYPGSKANLPRVCGLFNLNQLI